LLVSLLFVSELVLSTSPTCRDEDGNAVDWWVILKAPIDPDSARQNAQDGYGYSYTDPNQRLTFSDSRLDTDLTNSLGSTLAQVYGSSTNAFLMYNDESPDDVSHNSYGHLKGVLGFDRTAGFWLVHSVPRYPLGPASTSSYQGYPDYANVYGQSFLCVSYDFSQINLIAGGLLIDKPYVYDKKTPFSIPTTGGNITKLIAKQFVNTTIPSSLTIKLTSKAGVTFTAFAKNSAWNQDLYSALVQPKFKRDMLIETWMNGANSNEMPSFCKPGSAYNSINVREVTLADDVVFLETKDHSKWAINQVQTTSTTSGSLVCIGDINRQYSQAGRGGGTVCVNNKNLYLDFKASISDQDTC